jgi:2-polyprenyl-3-methyl-5-hydroxy-6-metoxy-1,4-benzoquinol methylase
MSQFETAPPPTQAELAEAMFHFVKAIPKSADLEWVKDRDFLFYFEAERLLTMRRALLAAGVKPEAAIQVLDFGYLHGLVPEFLHRFFPNARFTVLDHPQSPVFRTGEYQDVIHSRSYLNLQPCDISKVDGHSGTYDLIVLGEIIEHLDPTTVAKAVAALRRKIAPSGHLLITTPNGGGIYNTLVIFLGRDTQTSPIPDQTMGYGHIHLWTPTLLRQTLAHFGWKEIGIWFTHGKEAERFRAANRHWGSFRHQVMMKLIFVAANLCPRWRGFMVSTFCPAPPAAISGSNE